METTENTTRNDGVGHGCAFGSNLCKCEDYINITKPL